MFALLPEVIARAAWSKAAVQLDRVTGQMLDRTGISLKDEQGKEQRNNVKLPFMTLDATCAGLCH